MQKDFPRVIDSTMLASYSACERQFELAHLYNMHTDGKNIHLHAGGAYAKGLEVARTHYIETQDVEESVEAGIKALEETYGDYDSGNEAKSKDRMVGALLFYFDNYPLDTDPAQLAIFNGKPAVEFSFAIPLPIDHPETGEPLLFSGRCDTIVNFAGGLYAEDDKTTSSLGAQWGAQWKLRSQFTGYAWAMRELGMKPAGTLVRGVSILKTKYETQQIVVPQPPWKIDQWYQSSLKKIQKMIDVYKSGEPTFNLSESCNAYGGCSYKSVCDSSDPDVYLKTYYIRRVWNPLTHEEETNAQT